MLIGFKSRAEITKAYIDPSLKHNWNVLESAHFFIKYYNWKEILNIKIFKFH